jgi:hypothetical protein
MASSRGKQADKSTPWSETKWDNSRQLYYNDRYGPSGEAEYYWHPATTSENEESVPRVFGSQETTAAAPYQTPTYVSSATGGTVYPSAGDGSYTTTIGDPPWRASNTTWISPECQTQTSSIDTSSDNHGRTFGGSSIPYYGTSQYESGSELVHSASRNAAFNRYPSGEDEEEATEELNSTFSRMNINHIPDGGTSLHLSRKVIFVIDIHLGSSSQMPVPKPIYREPNSKPYETLDPSIDTRSLPSNGALANPIEQDTVKSPIVSKESFGKSVAFS